MTEKTPPPGKVWLTVEMDETDWNETACIDVWDLDLIEDRHGPEDEDPSDKSNRLLSQAEERFRSAAYEAHVGGSSYLTLNHVAAGSEFLADALKVLREEL